MQEKGLLKKLKERIEAAMGWEPRNRGDFDVVQKSILKQTGALLSATTLRRFWGYQERDKESSYRSSTLNALSVFAGFQGFSDFRHYTEQVKTEDEDSDFVVQRKVLWPGDLTEGARIHLTWEPDRRVILLYEGEDTFSVISSENSKLKVGDTMHCQQFVNGEPLFCKALIRTGRPLTDFVCGRNGGIRFQVE